VDGDVYAQPLYLPHVDIANRGAFDVVFVATEHGSVYAFDATKPGALPIWKTSFIDPALDITPIASRDASCPFIRPELGITPTPVIDPATGTLYVLMRTKEPTTRGDHRYVQRLHALNIRTGVDKLPPVEVRASVRGSGAGSKMGVIEFEPLRENPRAALLLSKDVVYLSWASACDVGPYHGWVSWAFSTRLPADLKREFGRRMRVSPLIPQATSTRSRETARSTRTGRRSIMGTPCSSWR
jgi:hypothetical protein